MTGLTRRDFARLGLGAGAGLAASAAVPVAAAEPLPAPALALAVARPAPLPAAKGPRLVVVGGGWSGLTIAKYVKRLAPDADVVLVERRGSFMSCPISNLWLADMVTLTDLTHSYLDAANAGGYAFLNASAFGVEREKRQVLTSEGTVAYDFLALAPGIGYDYTAFGVEDAEAAHMLRSVYPAAAVAGSEHLTLKNKILDFEGGTFVVTVPPGNFRCAAMPYERACMIAAVFKREQIPGKVLLIDPREAPAVKAEGFQAAFDELWGDHLEYMSTTMIEAIDPEARTITTDFDDIAFDDACIYPRVRAGALIEAAGLVDPSSLQKEALVDPFTYIAAGDERVWVAGDARNHPFSKSGNTARTEAEYVAEVIAARIGGQDLPPWRSPVTSCYSMVNAEPNEAIMVESDYVFDKATGEWHFGETRALEERSAAMGASAVEWARGHFRDMFG